MNEEELDRAAAEIEATLSRAAALSVSDPQRASLVDEAKARVGQVFGPDSFDAASVYLTVAGLALGVGEYAQARAELQRALAILPPEPREPDLLQLRLQALTTLGIVERTAGSRTEAVTATRSALALAVSHLEAGDATVLGARMAHGVACKLAGLHDEAREAYAGVTTHEAELDLPARADLAHNLAGLAHAEGAFETAREHAERAVALRRQVDGEDSVALHADLSELATILGDLGRLEEASTLHRATLAFFERTLGPDHYEVAHAHHELGALAHDRGQLDEAFEHYRQAVAVKERALGAGHGDAALSLAALGRVERDRGRPEEGVALLRRALPSLERDLGSDHPATRACREDLATS